MAKYCSECTYLDLSTGDIYGKFFCDKRLERHTALDLECYNFCTAYSRSSSEIKSAEEYSKNHSSGSSCFITTMICNILKVNDDNYYLNSLRKFRNNVLQKDEKYKSILVEYDIIGPIISKYLSKDPKRYRISANAFYKYIKPITLSIEQNNYDVAINSYMDMTNKLKNFYNIDVNIDMETINKADITLSGHGIYKQKRIAKIY